MTYIRKILTYNTLLILLLNGCDMNISSANYDSETTSKETQGKVYYKSGEIFGTTKSKKLNDNDTYELINSHGKIIGQISLDHTVLGEDEGNFIHSECLPKGDNDFDEDDYLIGSCVMTINQPKGDKE